MSRKSAKASFAEVTFYLSLDGWTGVGPVQKVRKSIPGRGRDVCNELRLEGAYRAGGTERMECDEGPMGLEVLPGPRPPVDQVQDSGRFS